MKIMILGIIFQLLAASSCQGVLTASREDGSLNILLNITLPLRDTNWYLTQFKKMLDNNFNISLSSFETEEREELLGIAEELDWSNIVSLMEMETKQMRMLGRKGGKRGERSYRKMKTTDKKFKKRGIFLNRSDPGLKNFKADPISKHNSRVGFIMEEATRFFKRRKNLSARAVRGLVLLKEIADYLKAKYAKLLVSPFEGRACKGEEGNRQAGVCNPLHQYRSMDGRCNNLQEVQRGSAFTRYRRILFPDYFRGISDLRRDQAGKPLPSARLISSKINRMTSVESSELSTFHMTFGQFLDHDITSTPVIKFETLRTGTIMRCCDKKLYKRNRSTKRARRIGCAPITIPDDDPFYSTYGQRCMEFLRSIPAPSLHLGPREQLNQQSAYLDGSVIYGTTQPVPEGDPLRSFVDGLLKDSVANNGQHLLPVSKDKEMLCNSPGHMANNEFCFVSGDGRVNEVVPLVFFHTVWCREHNRVAQLLKSFHPNATDEKIYQETRRILAAQLQHITFNEFLPTLIPYALLTKHDLLPRTGQEQTNSYDPDMDVSIANSFATATYRFGHSEIPDNITMVSSNGTMTGGELSSMFDPFPMYQNNSMELIARGGCLMKALKSDSLFTKEVTEKLFRGNSSFGLDLLALNIQRGRDHGLPGYTKWLARCGMPEVKHFQDLLTVMPYENMAAFKSAYKDVRDIDLYIGSVSETAIDGGLLGFTFTCLLTDQFKRMKFGDRFWYEETGQVGSFTPEQIEQLHKVSLSRLLCDNIPELTEIQQYLLKVPGPQNPIVSCSCDNNTAIPCIDMNPWLL